MKTESFLPTVGRAVVIGLCAAIAPAFAQDSTSLNNSYPGDSLDPHDNTEQVNDFIVDVAAFKSSYGRVFGVAPLAKASTYFTPIPHFFSAEISAHNISNHTELGVPFVRNSYDFWTGPGFGINGNPQANNPGTPIDTSNFVGNQFGFVIAEFSYDDPFTEAIAFNQVLGGTVNYEIDVPSRLYVSRVVGGTNSNDWFCNVSQFGIGGVDADGNVMLRADGYQTTACGGFNNFTGDNYFRLDLLSRSSSVVNVLHNAGGGAVDVGATSWLLINNGTIHNTPTVIPADITGGLPIVMGSNWGSQYVYGTGSPLTTTTAHLGTGSDHRGGTSYSHLLFPTILPGSVLGTGGVLVQAPGTNTLGLWGLSATGAPTSTVSLTLPLVVIDNHDGWRSDALGTAGGLSFANYYGSTAFRGGNGPVAMGSDQSGRLLAAGMAHHPNFVGQSSHNNLIAVARTSDGSNIDWTIAAWTADTDGKAVYGIAGTSTIGKIVGQVNSTDGGPALTSPMIDSTGNVYFNARVLLTGATNYENGLVRAVYDEANFSYKLELLLLEGDVFTGGNSQTDYQIRFLTVSAGDVSIPSAPFSHNVNQDAYNGLNPLTLDSDSPETLGGIVVGANIVYDTSGDGQFEAQDEVPGSTDQDYNVLLYVTSAKDCNDNGVPDDLDIADGTSPDANGNGIPDECEGGGPVGTPYCFGDGTGDACPCGNTGGTGEGCANSTGSGGVAQGLGSNSASADDLKFAGSNLIPGQGALLFVALNQLNGLFLGDGLRCAGGALIRLGVKIPDGSGGALWGPNLGVKGGWSAGDTRNFQIWYRDPGSSPCATEQNTTNGVSVTFGL